MVDKVLEEAVQPEVQEEAKPSRRKAKQEVDPQELGGEQTKPMKKSEVKRLAKEQAEACCESEECERVQAPSEEVVIPSQTSAKLHSMLSNKSKKARKYLPNRTRH